MPAADTSLVIVEGFFDVFRLWGLGHRRVVALLGSSLSREQEDALYELLPVGSRLVLLFDEDEAGEHAREDVLERLSRWYYVRAPRLPDGCSQPEHLTAEALASRL